VIGFYDITRNKSVITLKHFHQLVYDEKLPSIIFAFSSSVVFSSDNINSSETQTIESVCDY